MASYIFDQPPVDITAHCNLSITYTVLNYNTHSLSAQPLLLVFINKAHPCSKNCLKNTGVKLKPLNRYKTLLNMMAPALHRFIGGASQPREHAAPRAPRLCDGSQGADFSAARAVFRHRGRKLPERGGHPRN